MTDSKPTDAAASKEPSHYAYQVRDRENKKAMRTRIGSAWAHQDGAAHVAAYGQGLKPWAFGSGALRKGQEGSVVLRTTEPS